ncbi:helix-turn-helix domain-containing protein [Levilactobacillus parabrevis]|uniref:DNA-binding helix-turn-helix protein n=1 Tax=Levilactobacillus parabrevis ATCC 53295 TaxID=1267003 RepID=A0A0R1GRB8_9LACO|nr:helix-turn-helix transcriptional regulator [Levilactobacillus parabrevis]KRK36614.1 DNA-binding helix-turn-helix protein [Levilactobacillus parabrevis ATCC 53295]KRO06027.1 DNA-binding helix-turn-helix protein [Levilactobacillus parabrevis]
MSLGTTLKRVRKQQGRSQKDVATGICAQSMLSAIENDRYTPNAKLLVALCRRLAISLDEISLATDFAISGDDDLNTRMQALCNQHCYQELRDFLFAPETVAAVTTAQQTQAYYYYLGVAQLHVDAKLDDAKQNLQFAMTMTEERMPTMLPRLAMASLATVQAKQGLRHSATQLSDQALAAIEQAPYEENSNIIFYLAALTAYFLQNATLATQRLLTGIAYITAHNSHYMLANSYRLLAEIADRAGRENEATDARQKQQFLTDLFHEQVPKKF